MSASAQATQERRPRSALRAEPRPLDPAKAKYQSRPRCEATVSGSEILGESLPFDETIELEDWGNPRATPEGYKSLHASTLTDFAESWSVIAKELDWSKGWDATVSQGDHPHVYSWFSGGLLNLSYLALDRHANSTEEEQGRADLGGRAHRREGQPQAR